MASESLRPAPSGGPSKEVEVVLAEVLAEIEVGAWDSAIERLSMALDAHPGDPYLLCWLGLAERELGLDGPAYDHFRMALEAGSEDPILLATVGNALASSDDPAAGAALRTAALLGPALPQARWMYGAYLAREGMMAEALVELEAAVELDSEDPVIRLELGVARTLAGDLAGAAEAFDCAVQLDPSDGWCLVLLGLTRLEAGEVDEATPLLDEGARQRPEDLDAQLLAGLVLAATGWEDRAIEMLERARMNAEREDAALVQEAEDRIEEGPESALTFLRETLAPTSFRERLLARP